MVYHDPAKLDELFRLLRLQPGQTVLDVGTGTGVLIPRILRAVGPEGRLIALDLSAEMLKEARRRTASLSADSNGAPAAEFIQADFLQYEAPLEADVITAYSCFPHFADPDLFFRRSRTILAPRTGRLLIAHSESRQAINSLHTGLEASRKAPEEAPAISRPLPPAEDLARKAGKLGFDVLDKRDDNFCFFLLLRAR